MYSLCTISLKDMKTPEFFSLSLILVHCHPDCLTCSHSPNHCDLCQDPTKLLENGRCVHSCGLAFYQAGSLCLGMALVGSLEVVWERRQRGSSKIVTNKLKLEEVVMNAGNAQCLKTTST